MKNVHIILKCGFSIVTECEDIGMEWNKDGALKWLDMEGASPEVAFIDLDSVACVVVGESRFTKRKRRDAVMTDAAAEVAEGAAAPLLRSAT